MEVNSDKIFTRKRKRKHRKKLDKSSDRLSLNLSIENNKDNAVYNIGQSASRKKSGKKDLNDENKDGDDGHEREDNEMLRHRKRKRGLDQMEKNKKKHANQSKQDRLFNECEYLTRAESAALGVDGNPDDSDLDLEERMKTTNVEAGFLSSDSDLTDSQDEDDIKSHSVINSNQDDSDENSNNHFDGRVRLDPNSLYKYHRRIIMPNVGPDDLRPYDDLEMETLLEMRIIIDWEVSPVHRIIVSMDQILEELGSQVDQFKIYSGRFTFKERKYVIDRICEFKTLYAIRNPLYHMSLLQSKLKKSQKLKFFHFLAKGLEHRTLLSIYREVRKMYHPFNYMSRKQVRAKLKSVHKLMLRFGKKWTKIGRILKLRDSTIFSYYRYHEFERTGRSNSGHWSSSEYRRLIAALVAVTGERDLRKLHHGLPWMKVSKVMGTRNWNSCRAAWIYVLSKYVFAGQSGRKWNLADSIRLIEILHDRQYASELEIPWSDLYPLFDMSNCSQMISKWGMVRRKVPNYYIMPYEDQVEYLHKHILPRYKELLKTRHEKKEKLSEDSTQMIAKNVPGSS